MPRVSVIIPCRNSAKTLASTLRCLVSQSLRDWEAIVIDDGSTDETGELLAAAARTDRRIRVIDGKAQGASAARNLGIAQVRSDIIAFLDSDDIWEVSRLSTMVWFMNENPSAAIAYSRFAFFNETPGDSPTVSTVPDAPLTVLDLLKENLVGTMSNVMVRREAFSVIGPFREDLTHGEDREWLVRGAASGHEISGLNRTLLHYRTSVGGLSSDLSLMFDGWRASVATARALGALPAPRALRDAEATYLRYLARRSLRLGLPAKVSTKLALQGALVSPRGFFDNKKRGALTIGAALASNIAPNAMRSALANR
jgi:glycosyltransferase involved in cell wall biosynthesis